VAKPGQPLPDALGDLPTLAQVAAAPPRRTRRATRQQLRRCGIPTRNVEGYPKEGGSHTAHVSRVEWERGEALHTRSITNRLREGGLKPQPA
jgi:hypothetical protein